MLCAQTEVGISWEYQAAFPVAPPPAPPREPQVRVPSRTRCREGTTVTEDAARSAPARSPAPGILCSGVPHATVSSQSNRHPDECSPAPPGPPEPSHQADHASLQPCVSSATDAARHSLADTSCPAMQEHTPASALTASYTRRSRVRVGT